MLDKRCESPERIVLPAGNHSYADVIAPYAKTVDTSPGGVTWLDPKYEVCFVDLFADQSEPER